VDGAWSEPADTKLAGDTANRSIPASNAPLRGEKERPDIFGVIGNAGIQTVISNDESVRTVPETSSPEDDPVGDQAGDPAGDPAGAQAGDPEERSRQAALDARVLTIPNLISVARLAAVPVFVWLLFGREDRGSASILLGVLGSTDWVDGQIARRFNQGSTLGKIIDPAADRIMLVVAIVCMFLDDSVPKWVFWVVFVREAIVSLATVGLAALGARRIDVQWVGKAGTFGLMVAFPCFLASRSGWSTQDGFRIAAWVWLIPSLALSYYAAATYIPLGREALREGRAARVGQR
jgi:cardiolipin synthase (CMP-forming)